MGVMVEVMIELLLGLDNIFIKNKSVFAVGARHYMY